MEILLDYLHQGFSAVVPFVILLGILIFVHELGHFLVAKFFGVKVEVFSLGFGKKILQYQKGDTNYCISLIPLGGYVKMYGDDPSADIPEENKAVSFLHKAVGPRIAIVLAGPLMNFFFAILVFFVVSLIGEDVKPPLLGDVMENTPAHSAGFRAGDKIIEVNGAPIATWSELSKAIKDKVDVPVSFKVEREFTSEVASLSATPKLQKNPNVLSSDDYVGNIEGFSQLSKGSVVAVKSESPLAKAGLQTGDFIYEINEQAINNWRELTYWISKIEGTINLKVLRQDQKLDIQITETMVASIDKATRMDFLGIDSPDLYIEKVAKDTPAMAAGFLMGDKILSINSQPMKEWDSVLETVKAYKEGEPALKFEVERAGQSHVLEVIPKLTVQEDHMGQEDKRNTIGVVSTIKKVFPKPITIKAASLGQAIFRGVEKSWDVTVMTAMSFVKLVQNKISPKNLGGVIAIGQAASETFKIGMSHFLQMMGVISINLFILNLLPIPVLDGGHLLFYTVEALRGAPLSMRKMEIAQQVGLFLLMTLMVFALFNDFSRIFNW